MRNRGLAVVCALVMVGVVVAVDMLFLRDHLWARLLVNVCIVGVFGTVAWKLFRR